jgi:hypothetical protein
MQLEINSTYRIVDFHGLVVVVFMIYISARPLKGKVSLLMIHSWNQQCFICISAVCDPTYIASMVSQMPLIFKEISVAESTVSETRHD